MDMLLVSEHDKIAISEVYILCNTPRSLYNSFRGNDVVHCIAKNYTTEYIIMTFLDLGQAGIKTIQDLAFAYSLYISLTFKEYDEVVCFYNNEGNIKFEWFPDIKNIYFSSYIHTNQFSIAIDKFYTHETFTVITPI